MIHLFSNKKKVKEFKNFKELVEFFNHIENSKLVDYNSYYGQEKWNFVFYPHKRRSALNEHTKNPLTKIEEEAYENEFDMIEVYVGDPQTPEQFVITSKLDLQEFMRDWCFDYGYAHGYRVLELIDGYADSEDTKGQFPLHNFYGAFKKDKNLTVAQNHNFGQ